MRTGLSRARCQAAAGRKGGEKPGEEQGGERKRRVGRKHPGALPSSQPCTSRAGGDGLAPKKPKGSR